MTSEHDVTGRYTDSERAALLHRGQECDNPDHAHYTQRFGQVIRERNEARARANELQRLLDEALVAGAGGHLVDIDPPGEYEPRYDRL